MSTIGVNLTEARSYLQNGQLVAIPTETVYGLAADAFNQKAVLSIFEVKNRPAFDPLIVHASSIESIEQFVSHIPLQARQLAEKFWPGPLTMLLPRRSVISDLVTSGLPTVAVRIPNHAMTLQLLESLDFPLAAPSANPFGYISPTSAMHVEEQLGDKIPYILDGGPSNVGIESTIIGFQQKIPLIVRLGGLQLEEIESVIGKVEVSVHSSSNPMAPGMLKSHYAPRKPLYLVTSEEIQDIDPSDEVGFLYFQKPKRDKVAKNSLILSESGDLKEAAYKLFSYMRRLDAMPVQKIWAELVPSRGLGLAINDRLNRASIKLKEEYH